MSKAEQSYLDYNHPSEIVDDHALSKAQKIEFLKCWEMDEYAISRANSDGMATSSRKSLLRYVRKALATIEDEKEH